VNAVSPHSAIARRPLAHRIGAGIAIAALLLTSACATGQHAATAEVVPAIDGTSATVGSLKLEGVAIQAPTGSAYAAGSKAELSVVIVNSGHTADTLNNVTSPAYTSWGVVSTADASAGSGVTSAEIGPGSALSLGLKNLDTGTGESAKTLVLSGLTKKDSPLFPGSSVKITFTFAQAGSATVTVPVQLSSSPNQASVPAPSGSPGA
jgi:hypothetical protein